MVASQRVTWDLHASPSELGDSNAAGQRATVRGALRRQAVKAGTAVRFALCHSRPWHAHQQPTHERLVGQKHRPANLQRVTQRTPPIVTLKEGRKRARWVPARCPRGRGAASGRRGGGWRRGARAAVRRGRADLAVTRLMPPVGGAARSSRPQPHASERRLDILYAFSWRRLHITHRIERGACESSSPSSRAPWRRNSYRTSTHTKIT